MKTKLLTSGGFCLLILAYFIFKKEKKTFEYQGEKMNGLSFVAPHLPINKQHIDPVVAINANYLSLMPYAFLPKDSTQLLFAKPNEPKEGKHVWWGETPEGVDSCIVLAHNNNLKIMLKPHLWLGRGGFTGELDFQSEKDWVAFENSYRDYVLLYAQLAEKNKVALFCLGTELENMVKKRPHFFENLIVDIRKIYKGKLTYAENWNCFEVVPFIDKLDFIGVDAYFPLTDKAKPSMAEMNEAWAKWQKKIGKYSTKHQKAVIFTEFGYRSCDFAAAKPWEMDYSLPSNEKQQADALTALFSTAWRQPWMAGGFVWKWFPLKENDKPSRDLFCIRNKLAEKVVSQAYSLP